MKTLNDDLKYCRVFYYKSFNSLFSFVKKNYDLGQFKNIKLLTNINYVKNNTKPIANPYPLLIYVNEKEQIIIGKRVFCVFYHENQEQNNQRTEDKQNLYNNLKRINLTEKLFVQEISNFVTDNIMEIHLSKDNYFNYFDSHILYGSRIQLSSEFDEIMQNENLVIKQIKFQLFDQSVVTIRDENQIEFNKNTSDEEKLSFIIFLSDLLNDLW